MQPKILTISAGKKFAKASAYSKRRVTKLPQAGDKAVKANLWLALLISHLREVLGDG